MKKEKIKKLIAIILIVLFTFSVVPKTFQNDTFYIIELGKCISENGVDFQDHYSIHGNLEYRYPHWLFDVINGNIYNLFGFTGVHVFTQILASIFMLIVFWNMLRKEINFNLAFIATLLTAYLMKGSFYTRGQIVSYSLFLLEYMVLENFVERPTFFKCLALFGLSCVMANIHSTAWIMMLVLILPFIGEQVVYFYSLTGINERITKRLKKKYQKAKEKGASKEILDKIEENIKQRVDFKSKYKVEEQNKEHKIIIKEKKNIKYIWVAIVVLILGALCTPLKLTPFTYFLKISIGKSMGYISEHMPIVPAGNLEFFSYSAILIAILGFTKSKLKLYDAFLILGLYIMTLSGVRNEYLLIGLTAGIITKMIDDFVKENTENKSEKFKNVIFIVICVVTVGLSVYMFVQKIDDEYVNKKLYPVEATKYIKDNLDYKNIRIYNRYDYGSYLLMNEIPVLLDSRCDLYTPEFNRKVTVFDDFMDVQYLEKSIASLMDDYDLEYALVPVDGFEDVYVKEDNRFEEIYRDKYFVIYHYSLEK